MEINVREKKKKSRKLTKKQQVTFSIKNTCSLAPGSWF